MPPIGGGASLGIARGSIEIDTRSLVSVQATARSVGASVAKDLGQIDAAAKQNQLSLQNIGKGVQQLQGQIAAIGVGAGLTTLFGLNAAKEIRNYTISFTQLLGSQKEAKQTIDQVTKSADTLGLELSDTLQLARALAPSLKGGPEELDKWIERAARLRSVMPNAPSGSEVIALAEAQAGQFTSLNRRFNVSLDLIQQAKNESKDTGQIIDTILDRMGATSEGAREMADGFVSARNELKSLAAEGFGALYKALNPTMKGVGELIRLFRETAPATATFGAGLTAVVAVGAPALIMLNQLAQAQERLAKAGALAGALGTAGKIGLGIGAAAVGWDVGTSLGNAINRYRGAPEVTGQGQVDELRQLAYIVKYYLSQAMMSFSTGIAQAAKFFIDQLVNAADALASFASMLARLLPGSLGEGAAKNAELYTQTGDYLHRLANDIVQQTAIQNANKMAELKNEGIQIAQQTGVGAGYSAGSTNALADLQRAWYADVQRIEMQANEQRLQETQQYEAQRTQIIQQYELTIAREAEDYGRQRARAEQQLQKQLASISADQAAREAQYAIDLADSIAKIQSDGNQRIADIEHDYQKQRERALQEHNDNLFKAAGELDAKALAEENRRFATSSKNAQDDFSDRIAKEKEQINQRVQDEIEANDKRIQEGRKADLQRSLDLQQSYDEQRQQEAEDRAIRLSRMAEDHQLQLAQLDTAHTQRLAQIDQHAADERRQLDDEFQKQLAEKGKQNEVWKQLQDAKEKAAEDAFNKWWDNITKKLQPQGPAGAFFPGFNQFEGRASGGYIPTTKPYLLHQGEYVLNKSMVDMLGGSSGPMAWGGGNKTLNIADGAIRIQAAAGQSAGDIGDIVAAKVIALFQELA